jgi:hypothetical protein
MPSATKGKKASSGHKKSPPVTKRAPARKAAKAPPKPHPSAKKPTPRPAAKPTKPATTPAGKPVAKPSTAPSGPPKSPDARRHVLSLSFLRDGDEFMARLETDAGQITELKNRSLDQLLTLVANELEDLLE